MLRNITFTELEELLLKLGFTSLPTAGLHHVFQYASSGALVVLPGYEKKAHYRSCAFSRCTANTCRKWLD